MDNTARRRFFIAVIEMAVVEIDASDHLMTEQHLAVGVSLRHRAQSDRQMLQCFADTEGVAPEVDSLRPGPCALRGRVGNRWAARFQEMGSRRSGEVQRVVRTAQIVAVAETIKFALAVLKRGEIKMAQDLELERAMETLVLALRLRMIRAAMTDADAEADQPQAQGSEGHIAVAPRARRCPSASPPATHSGETR